MKAKSRSDAISCRSDEASEFQWRLSNGLWALSIAFGTVLSALKVQTARSWRFFQPGIRGFLADYGVTIAVVFWSCLSYALQGAPQGIPRRLALPNTWDVKSTWTVANVCNSAAFSATKFTAGNYNSKYTYCRPKSL